MKRALGLASAFLWAAACGQGAAPAPGGWEGHSIAGPWTQGNLTIFLIEKKGAPGGDLNLLSMEEAIEAGGLRVTESEGGGQVNLLVVENSGERPVLLQAGDTLKGGKQDRTIAKDTVVPPRSGKVSVDAFCVEPGRWSQRASASADFRANDVPLATKEQRLAVQLDKDQQRVWEAGRSAIRSLAPGNDSYVLASEDPKFREDLNACLKSFQGLIEGREDVVGMAYAIGGKLHSAEVYGTTGLLRKFWPKLLRRSVVEAMARRDAAGTGGAVAAAGDVELFLRGTQQSVETAEAGAAGMERAVRRSSGAVRIDARWGGIRIYSKLD